MKKIKYNERKKYLIRGSILLLIGIASLAYIIYSNVKNNSPKDNNKVTDAINFKTEYESLNSKDDKYLSISIDKENPIKYIKENELDEFLNDGTGIIYFGFPECPWCRNLVPVLLDALKEKDINEIYYLNVKNIRDEKELNNEGEIVVKKEGNDIYSKILEKFNDYLPIYEGLNDNSIKRLYSPAIFFLVNGEVVSYHFNTVDSQEDPSIPLNREQYDELKNILMEKIDTVYNFKCVDGC